MKAKDNYIHVYMHYTISTIALRYPVITCTQCYQISSIQFMRGAKNTTGLHYKIVWMFFSVALLPIYIAWH